MFFDDNRCFTCGTPLGYRPDLDDVVDAGEATGAIRCDGAELWGCPWLLADGVGWCVSCRLDLDDPAQPSDGERRIFELAKRRVVRQLLAARIDLAATPQLRFRFERTEPGRHVTIGHADGLVTLDLAEADPVTSERNRARLGEPYRTPLGHVRHETGHWHWQAWVATVPERLERFRGLFGDERDDYAAALERHYEGGDDGGWRNEYVTFYASAHPWEDYAESFAHVLHILDTIETAHAHDLIDADPIGALPFEQWYPTWLDTSVAINELSRSMGVADPYPFAPPPQAVAKLRFAHEVLVGARPASPALR